MMKVWGSLLIAIASFIALVILMALVFGKREVRVSDFKYPIAWMNGTPRQCQNPNCAKFLPCKGRYVVAWQSSISGKLFCTEECEDMKFIARKTNA